MFHNIYMIEEGEMKDNVLLWSAIGLIVYVILITSSVNLDAIAEFFAR